MKIHEYQAKRLFQEYGMSVPNGIVAFSVEESISAAKKLNAMPVVVKAQIHAGGRGKSGGVKEANSLEEVRVVANEIIGMHLVTHQTSSKGRQVRKVLIEQKLDVAEELYFSILPDRTSSTNVIMASRSGGMDIEAVAKKTPEKIVRVHVDPLLGIQDYHCRNIIFGLSIPDVVKNIFSKTISNLYKMFIDYDCSLVEINPMAITVDHSVVALDAKVDFDSNALYRHKDILNFRDTDEEDPLEVEASKHNLNYINLGDNGSIGNMVNGAGLAMATMDIIKKAGAEPANFLDVGGGANAEMIEHGFKIILSDDSLKGIFINIFGGILRCDILAKGVVKAAKKVGLSVPVLVRMEGTNVEEGHKILAESGLTFIMVKSLEDAANYIAKIATW